MAARALLETLALDGVLVTGDAMHAQSATAQVILGRGGDYIFQLKAKQVTIEEADHFSILMHPANALTLARLVTAYVARTVASE